ncbi:UbiX family flavin prenyltransferase [Natrialba sp. INN-245]|uniref:UbiX family flavin prenyltransferase n=1 Tax=Natrialba sp. INN-245 TaxID=2690967 RepID=UPI00130F9E9D|nr:UbiX family flavin prenyltransferase [Natrialba sp. INN-245]MWV38506.1 UbiX family flavin prenyltransferase [Natrialba sp. INN-245]
MSNRVVVAFTGATGQLFGVKALELLDETPYESHLILSRAAKMNLEQESDQSVEEVRELADTAYNVQNVGAPPASGSFRTQGTLVCPCSMKTLSNIAHGNAGNLITRTADVSLKERQPLVLMPREKPLNRIHIQNMLDVTDAGGIIYPPFLSFYQQPESLEEAVTRTMARALSFLGVDVSFDEWNGMSINE